MSPEPVSQFRRRLAAFFLGFAVIAVHQPGSGAQSDDVIADPESYAVFAAALTITGALNGRTVERVTLLQETRAVPEPCPDEKALPPEWRPVVANHQKENAGIRTLRPDADLGRPYSIVSLADLRTLMRNAGYDLSTFSGQQSPGAHVFRGFPGGRLVAFSAVGFDEQKTRAMVTVQYDCFPTAENQPPYRYCHEYRQLMLQKHEGKWVTARSVGACGGGIA